MVYRHRPCLDGPIRLVGWEGTARPVCVTLGGRISAASTGNISCAYENSGLSCGENDEGGRKTRSSSIVVFTGPSELEPEGRRLQPFRRGAPPSACSLAGRALREHRSAPNIGTCYAHVYRGRRHTYLIASGVSVCFPSGMTGRGPRSPYSRRAFIPHERAYDPSSRIRIRSAARIASFRMIPSVVYASSPRN